MACPRCSHPGREYEHLVAKIAADFAQLEAPVAAKIRRVAQLTGEVPAHLPDLMVSWQENDRPWDQIIHPRFRAAVAPHKFHRSTYHSYRGFIGALDAKLLEGIPEILDIPDFAAHLRRICA